MNKNIEAVIFDWAGTTVDYGCFAPVKAFAEVFRQAGIEPTMDEVREPMGMLKRDHIKTMLEMPRIRGLWEKKYEKSPSEADIDQFSDAARKMAAIPAQKTRWSWVIPRSAASSPPSSQRLLTIRMFTP